MTANHYNKDIPVGDPSLASWKALNAALMSKDMVPERCKVLLRLEQAQRNRAEFVLRIVGRMRRLERIQLWAALKGNARSKQALKKARKRAS